MNGYYIIKVSSIGELPSPLKIKDAIDGNTSCDVLSISKVPEDVAHQIKDLWGLPR